MSIPKLNSYDQYVLSMLRETAGVYYPMQELALASQVDDWGTNAQHLTLNAAPTPAQAGPGIRRSWGFVSASSQFLSHIDSATLGTGNITWSFLIWRFATDVTATHGIAAKGLGAQFSWELLWSTVAGGSVTFNALKAGGISVGTIVVADPNPLGNAWDMIYVEKDIVSGNVGMSINNSVLSQSALTDIQQLGTGDFAIGRNTGNYDTARLGGAFLIKRILSSQERTRLYQLGLQ